MNLSYVNITIPDFVPTFSPFPTIFSTISRQIQLLFFFVYSIVGLVSILLPGKEINVELPAPSPWNINSLPNKKFLDWTKLKTFADDKLNIAKMKISLYERNIKHCRKRRKCWLPAFSPFPTMLSKNFSVGGCKKMGLCCKGLTHYQMTKF